MPPRSHIHVIDADVRRRAQIAYEMTSRNLHAEIYDGLDEFAPAVPAAGAVFIADASIDCGPSALRALLQAKGSSLPFAAYAEDPLPQRIVAAMLDGAVDYLRWPFDTGLLDTALDRLVLAGERRTREQRRQAEAKAAISELSERELEVLGLMIHGNSSKEIGRKLDISPRTAEIHRANMMRKLRARSPSDAVRMAITAGFGDDSEDGAKVA